MVSSSLYVTPKVYPGPARVGEVPLDLDVVLDVPLDAPLVMGPRGIVFLLNMGEEVRRGWMGDGERERRKGAKGWKVRVLGVFVRSRPLGFQSIGAERNLMQT